MKKIISLVLCLCLLATGLVACSKKEKTTDESKNVSIEITETKAELFTYEVVEEVKEASDGQEGGTEYSIKLLSYEGNTEELIIPKTIVDKEYGELKVTAIADKAFANNEIIYEATIPSTVTSIGKDAFAKAVYLTYEIPEEELIYTVDIDYNNIDNSIKITGYTGDAKELVIPSALTHKDYGKLPVTAIGDSAFLCNETIESVTLPEGVTTLGVGAFQSCTKLETVVLPETLTTIGENCFNNSAVKTINIPETVTSIGKYAFSSYINETPWYAAQTAQKVIVGDGILLKYNGKGNVDFGDEVKSIAYYAFDNPGEIEVTLGNEFKSIDKLAIFDLNGEYKVTFNVPYENTLGVAALGETQYKYVVIGAPAEEPTTDAEGAEGETSTPPASTME